MQNLKSSHNRHTKVEKSTRKLFLRYERRILGFSCSTFSLFWSREDKLHKIKTTRIHERESEGWKKGRVWHMLRTMWVKWDYLLFVCGRRGWKFLRKSLKFHEWQNYRKENNSMSHTHMLQIIYEIQSFGYKWRVEWEVRKTKTLFFTKNSLEKEESKKDHKTPSKSSNLKCEKTWNWDLKIKMLIWWLLLNLNKKKNELQIVFLSTVILLLLNQCLRKITKILTLKIRFFFSLVLIIESISIELDIFYELWDEKVEYERK